MQQWEQIAADERMTVKQTILYNKNDLFTLDSPRSPPWRVLCPIGSFCDKLCFTPSSSKLAPAMRLDTRPQRAPK